MGLHRFALIVACGLAFSASFVDASDPDSSNGSSASRTFRFTYAGRVTGLAPGTQASVWIPLAQDAFEQRVQRIKMTLPGEVRISERLPFGNRVAYFEPVADAKGEIPFSIEYRVERRELVRGHHEPVEASELALLARNPAAPAPKGGYLRLLFGANRDTLPNEPAAIGQRIYDAVDDHMRYDKPPGGSWGRGDALWACHSGYGNCTDFHSLFAAAAREIEIPVRFEIGFLLPTERGGGEIPGYHCWAKFAANGRWNPVDISEADKHPELKKYYFGNLTADRIMISTGRNLRLEPPQQAGPVNFLVYPYVEVDGSPHSSFVSAFRFEDE